MDMVKHKRLYQILLLAAGLAPCHLILMAEAPSNQPSTSNITIFDDRTFNLDGGTAVPETRKSAGGNTRYLDKGKELDYNSAQRDAWIASCETLREKNYGAFKDCVAKAKKKELGGRTGFGARESSSGSDGLNGLLPPPEARPSPPTVADPQSEE